MIIIIKHINKQQQLKELYINWDELEAYRRLNGQSFDFGTGLIKWDDPKSENIYWKMEQQDVENYIDYLENKKINCPEKGCNGDCGDERCLENKNE